jgi:hypothetical protein
MRHISPLQIGLRGYRHASPAERTSFAISAAFAATIGASRLINYVRERRRSVPHIRSWVRKAYHAPGQEKLRVHHFTPGIAMLIATGYAAIATRHDGKEWRFSVPFGVGAGLTLDELALLVELDNPYWESEKFALAQGSVGAATALGLAMRFHHRGASLPRPAAKRAQHPADSALCAGQPTGDAASCG